MPSSQHRDALLTSSPRSRECPVQFINESNRMREDIISKQPHVCLIYLISQLTSMYLDADDPIAKENETKRVDIETSKGQGLKFNKDRMTRKRTNAKELSIICSNTWLMTDALPTEARKYRNFLYRVSQDWRNARRGNWLYLSGRKSLFKANCLGTLSLPSSSCASTLKTSKERTGSSGANFKSL